MFSDPDRTGRFDQLNRDPARFPIWFWLKTRNAIKPIKSRKTRLNPVNRQKSDPDGFLPIRNGRSCKEIDVVVDVFKLLVIPYSLYCENFEGGSLLNDLLFMNTVSPKAQRDNYETEYHNQLKFLLNPVSDEALGQKSEHNGPKVYSTIVYSNTTIEENFNFLVRQKLDKIMVTFVFDISLRDSDQPESMDKDSFLRQSEFASEVYVLSDLVQGNECNHYFGEVSQDANDDIVLEEDELNEEEDQKESDSNAFEKHKLSREQREHIRAMNVKRKRDFVCLERVNGEMVNILEGLELHSDVFNAAEQKRIVDKVCELQEKGRKGELKRAFTARGKGRSAIQFGACFNYRTSKAGNPAGILRHEAVDPLPCLFKVIIRRMVKWHVLPPTCVPDCCVVNIYDEGDCIPPHVDNHDFLRPFCTVSFLSECNILFGSNLKVEETGEYSGGSYSLPLPVGISITFRKMDESKRPVWFTPEPDLQGIQPLPYELKSFNSSDCILVSEN
ncbi:hypothetical protein EUTSA_v10012104mg, partial [Eutrema salsugineum]